MLLDTFQGHTNTVYHMDMRDNMLLSCSLDETVKLWTVPTLP
jgi:WD40 repeat protein